MRKLYIYDKSDGIDRRQANGRFDPDDDIVTLAVENIADLTQRLNRNYPRGAFAGAATVVGSMIGERSWPLARDGFR
ncbi:hypothetical protein Q8W71_30880 [Methylobacterium sp. NEAU 140]|uniref:hypothetical protein n=1 Tax=Methylobacterium sp. NEAU 140 TaxID=3064945 RepID=UPI002733870C|nr:hypothetical protein [Methylobacterium sp. NEAU 140]MDP4026997.1 hypothetical protein [Methylobacterium sp. NEAU 140]